MKLTFPNLLRLLCLALVLGLSTGAAHAVDSCIQDIWQAHGNKQSLSCTAKDVTLASVENICIKVQPGSVRDPDGDGCLNPNDQGQLTCIEGQPFTFSADFTLPLTASERYDIGLYVATDGGGADGAKTGQCTAGIITADNALDFLQLDTAPDTCGDIDSFHNPQVIRLEITTTCTAASAGKVNLPWCTSWRQPGSNETCTTPDDAFPGSPSKCNCGDLAIDVFTETASITVLKTALTPTVPETGGSVTYSVSVNNDSQVSTLTMSSLTDNLYGDITATSSVITATTCGLVVIPAEDYDINNENPYTCTFTVAMGPANAGTVVTDTVTAVGYDQFGNNNIKDDDDAMVTYTDVQTDPDLTKTATGASIQVDVTFMVNIKNNSTVDTLTVKSPLTDNVFGDITSVHGNVISTTCGSMINANIAPGQNKTCSFVGRITSSGLHTDTVTGSAVDDDGVSYGAPELQDSAQVNIGVTFP